MASFKEFIESFTQKPIKWTDEEITEALAGDYVADDTDEEELPDLMEKRYGIPRERAIEFLKANPPAKKQEEKQELLNAYGLATPYGRKVSSDFLKENKIENIYNLDNAQYDDLAKKALDKYGFKDLDEARDFIGDNDESDKLWEERLARRKGLEAKRKPIDKDKLPF